MLKNLNKISKQKPPTHKEKKRKQTNKPEISWIVLSDFQGQDETTDICTFVKTVFCKDVVCLCS